MKKRTKPEETKQKLINLARRQIVTKGYSATSINSICQEADITKGGFFHHFPSKEALAEATLEQFWASRKELLDELRSKETDPIRRVMVNIDFVLSLPKNERNNFGCLLGVLGQEISLTNAYLQKVLAKKFDAWKEAVVADLVEAEKHLRPRQPIDKEGLADYILSVLQGSLLMARANKNIRIIQTNRLLLDSHLKSLFPAKK